MPKDADIFLPDTMTAVLLTGHGGFDKLVVRHDVPVPRPKSGQALVQVTAAGVNNTDINTRVGWYSKSVTGAAGSTEDNAQVEEGGWDGALAFPRIQGADLCGRVVALADDVSNLAIGARVTCATNQPSPTPEEPTRFQAIGSEYDGAFAQYCAVPADQLFDVSASPLSDVEIAAMPCNYGTALNLIRRAGLTQDDRVLVTGASGGVGLAAVALAYLRGAIVTGMAGRAKHDAVLRAGASACLERHETPPGGTFSVVIDLVGGPNWPSVLTALVRGGRYAVSGAIAGPIVEMDLRTLYLNDLTVYGCTFTPREVFEELVDLINQGAVRPQVARTYSLDEIVVAQREFIEKARPGKLVLLPSA